MCVGMSGTACVKSLQGSEVVLGTSPFEASTTLASLRLGDLQFAIEGVDLGRDIENAGVRLVVASDLCRQPPVVGAAGQVHGLMVRCGLPADGVDEPHGKWLGGGVADVGGGGIQIVLEDGIVFLAEGAECERDRAVAQFDVARLAHDIVGVGDDKVGESAVVLFEPFGALCVGLA